MKLKAILGRKLMMHQLFTIDGEMIPVTFLKIHPNFITQIKTKKNAGYDSVQIATGDLRKPNLAKPQQKHFAVAKIKRVDFCHEFRTTTDLKLGDQLDLTNFKVGMFVDVTATSKGKGTAGVIKRHNFSRGPMTHGSKHHRAPGSVGISRPDKVWKGQPLPGRMGNVRTTIQNLEVIQVNSDQKILALRGSVPGFSKNWVQIRQSIQNLKDKKPVQLYYFANSKLAETMKSSPTSSKKPAINVKTTTITPTDATKNKLPKQAAPITIKSPSTDVSNSKEIK